MEARVAVATAATAVEVTVAEGRAVETGGVASLRIGLPSDRMVMAHL